MAEPIFFKTNKGRHYQLDEDHYFQVLELLGKDVCVCRLKCKGWDGMKFLSIKQWLLIKPHLKLLFSDSQHTYYKYTLNN